MSLIWPLRCSRIPLIAMRYSSSHNFFAPHGMALGGLRIVLDGRLWWLPRQKTYMGLDGFGVGVIPGGGWFQRKTLRASDTFRKMMWSLMFTRILLDIGDGQKVSTSAYEGIDMEYLKRKRY